MKGYIKKLLKEGLNHTLHKNYEGYHNDINQLIPNIEKKYNLRIIKILGESRGIAYLTSDNKVVKFTPSTDEYEISHYLLNNNNNNKYFPQIYHIDILDTKQTTLHGDWYIIIKELISNLDSDTRAKINKLFEELSLFYFNNETTLVKSKSISICDIVIKSGSDLFSTMISREEEYKDLKNIYFELLEMCKELEKTNVSEIDVHVDNFGLRGDKLVLFDY